MKKKKALIIGDSWISGKDIKKNLEPYFNYKINFNYVDWNHKNLHELQNDNLKIEMGDIESIKNTSKIYKNIKEYNIIIVHFAPLKKNIFVNNNNLEIIASLRSGLDNISREAKDISNLKIINNPGRNANAVAEYTIAMMLNLTRQLYYFMDVTKKQNWPKKTSQKWGLEFKIGELKSSTIGLVGFGVIGKKVANILKAFGANILIFEPNKSKHNRKFKFTSLKELLIKSDIISLHAKNDAEIINKSNFKFLKKNAYIINSSRAKLIDENILIKSIKNRKIYGAAIDVFKKEPIPKTHEYKKMKNVIITPHIAGATDQMLLDCIHLLGKRLKKILR